MKKSHEVDLTKGSILRKLIIFALPLIGVNLLQLLFSTADTVVLGVFSSDRAVAAVGATLPIVNLLIGFFVGLSIGVNVLVAKSVGANQMEKSRRLVGTSLVASIVFGCLVLLVGFFCARTFMLWTKCDEAVLDYATTYLKIYFLGMPVIMLYNFSASILRAVGDTMRPFIYLIIGGVVNVFLNVTFIVGFGMNVEGVAIATVVSQGISAVLACIALAKSDGFSKVERKNLKLRKIELIEIFKIGLPIGVSKCLFSFSNVFVQSAINSLGEFTMAASSIGHQFDSFINEALHGISMASLSFISQNVGAKNMQRVKKTIYVTVMLTLITAGLIASVILPLAPVLCGIMTDNAEVIDLACDRIYIMGGTYVLCGIMCCMQESLRGLGKSFLSTIITLIATCLLRILWLKTIYYINPTQLMVYVVYPISWVVCAVTLLVFIIPTFNNLKKKFELENQEG